MMLSLVLVGSAGCWTNNPGFATDTEATSSTSTGSTSRAETNDVPTEGSAGGSGGSSTGEEGSSGTSAADTSSSGSSSSSGANCPTCECQPGETKPCYNGPVGTESNGICAPGAYTCLAEGKFSDVCEGEITPDVEVCGDGLDNDCDGVDMMCEATHEQCLGLPDSLVACYYFPPNTPALVDGSGWDRDGSKVEVFDIMSYNMAYGTAGKFLGVNNHALIPEDPAFDPKTLTVSMLVYPYEGGYLLDNEGQYSLAIAEGKVTCSVTEEGGTSKAVPSAIEGGAWSFVACVYDGSTVKLYVHSANVESSPSAEFPGVLNSAGSNGIVLGAGNPNFDKPIHAAMDQVLIFRQPLDMQQICALDPFCN